LNDASEERKVGNTTRIIPMMYDTILKRAHARTFNLQRKLEEVLPIRPQDEDIEKVLSMPLFPDTADNSLEGAR
jgi:hypothetical protein